jgi:precorrin isomerase
MNLIGNKFMEAVTAIGNAPITKVINGVMKGLATAKQVADMLAGVVLGPEAKEALRAALYAVPDTGTSYIDDATKGVLSKLL